jgi:hypothetical protein
LSSRRFDVTQNEEFMKKHFGAYWVFHLKLSKSNSETPSKMHDDITEVIQQLLNDFSWACKGQPALDSSKWTSGIYLKEKYIKFFFIF